MVINNNLPAQAATTQLAQASTRLAQSLQRLSSGAKITTPADDSAGLAVSMKLTAQMARINATMSNLENAVSFVQTQDGYLQKIGEALTRMGELAVLATDATKTDDDRADYSVEFDTLSADIRTTAGKDFNGVKLFSSNTLNVTMDSEANTFALAGIDLNSLTYAVRLATNHVNIIGNNGTGAFYAARDIPKVLDSLATDRAKLGAKLARLQYHHDELVLLREKLSAANSRITDVDVAQESTNYAKQNILVQSGTAMLAQANSLPQSVLKLLG